VPASKRVIHWSRDLSTIVPLRPINIKNRRVAPCPKSCPKNGDVPKSPFAYSGDEPSVGTVTLKSFVFDVTSISFCASARCLQRVSRIVKEIESTNIRDAGAINTRVPTSADR
jgi:hypothetical protein